ncbi:MAG TPA: transcription termination/antitermination NusG family protein [Candidatus Baltobacteraceae bacterium]|jgi:transcriptional antiterminator RfaH|nr:transcription termination/antitermination NusG family protein [Candidatus Baltobacteraceae bacterium]
MHCANRHLNFWQTSSWFAIRAKTRRESFAATNVRSLGLEVFFPKLKVDDDAAQGVGENSEPLFSGYFFARFCPELVLTSVECSHGVLQVVRSGRYPIPVDDQVIREIQERVEEDGLIRIRRPGLKPGDLISILDGPFEGMMARVERELDDDKRVAILLETLSCPRVLIEKRWVQAAA